MLRSDERERLRAKENLRLALFVPDVVRGVWETAVGGKLELTNEELYKLLMDKMPDDGSDRKSEMWVSSHWLDIVDVIQEHLASK